MGPALFMYKFISFLLLLSTAIPAQAACDNSNTNSTTNTSKTTQNYSETVIINEILPNPSSAETTGEFIELYNTATTAVDLTDWQLSDATDNVYTLAGSIGGKQYLTIYRSDSDLALNNSGDSVELLHPTGQLTDDVEYSESAPDDSSYALDSNGDWQWSTTVTPGKKNTITTNTAESDTNANQNTNNNTNQTNSNTNSTTNNNTSVVRTLQLSELLPDPEGSDSTDEWIELHNYGSSAVDLKGWQIADSSKTFTITTTTTLNSNGYIVFSIGQTGLSLNNSGETISLLDPNQQLTDSVVYEVASAGQSYALINQQWTWTTNLTPGEANSAGQTNSNTNTATLKTTAETDTAATMTIAQAKQAAVNTTVIVTGTVSVVPDIFGTQYFYIQDASGGVQVFSAKKLFPTLAIGDTVQVHGTIGTVTGEIKINTSAAEDIIILNHDTALQAIETQQYNPITAGQLVQITGTVQDKSGSTITLTTGWELYIKRNTGIKTSLLQNDAAVTVRGIVVANNEGIKVWPRSPADITSATTSTSPVNVNDPLALSTESSDNSTLSKTTSPLTNNTIPLAALAVVGGVVALIAGASRSDKIKQWLRQHVWIQVQNWVAQLYRWVGLEKNTMDSNVLNQYHESHPLGKKLS